MAIRDTYAELILEKILKEILDEGNVPTAAEIANRFDEFVAVNDISKPLFVADNYKVNFGEPASATKMNNTNAAILQDLKVIYRHLFKISNRALENFDRWRTESRLLECQLGALEERIDALVLTSSDTAGFFNFVQDNFVDTSKVDLSQTTAFVNVDKNTVSIGTNTSGPTRIDLNDLRDEDIEFTVLSRNHLVSTTSAEGSRTRNVTRDTTSFWQERVNTNKPDQVTIELKINLQTIQEISRIDVDLHQSNMNSAVQITPMLSTDNFNFTQLPISTFTRSIVDKTTFQFAPTRAKWVKFIITKTGFDVLHNGLYTYEFGIDEISMYREGFPVSDTGSTLYSKTLSVNDESGQPEEFSKIVLETCEDIPEGTSIDYFVAALNDPNEVVSSGSFVQIDPLNRKSSTSSPTVLDFGDLNPITISNIKLSYDPTASSDPFINPGKSFQLVQSISGTNAVISSGEASAPRYSFLNSNERILDHIIGSGVIIAKGTMELWRNVNSKGVTTKVRGRQAGWGFEDPYYKTTVYVDNPSGMDIDFGGKAVIIDGTAQTGKTIISQGRHTISVHKDNWKTIDTTNVTNLTTLKSADALYPYNHRYLVEGLVYPSVYPDTDEKIYRGFDIVAEFFAKEVSVFDLINNVPPDDYSKFALDIDVEDTGATILGIPTTKEPATVFLIKVDENNPDFINEDFLLKFKSANSLFKYLRFKAVLKTTDTDITPFLDSYRIKISS